MILTTACDWYTMSWEIMGISVLFSKIEKGHKTSLWKEILFHESLNSGKYRPLDHIQDGHTIVLRSISRANYIRLRQKKRPAVLVSNRTSLCLTGSCGLTVHVENLAWHLWDTRGWQAGMEAFGRLTRDGQLAGPVVHDLAWVRKGIF